MVAHKVGWVCHAIIIFSMCPWLTRSYRDDENRQAVMSAERSSGKKEDFVNMSSVTLVVTGSIPHSDFIKLVKVSSEPVGMTGDQSFIETLFLDKVPWYETMAWKHELYNNFRQSVETAKNDGYLGGEDADPFLRFLHMCPKEHSYESGIYEWVSARRIPEDVQENIAQQAELFAGAAQSLQSAVTGVKEWIAAKKDFAHWIQQKIEEEVDWTRVLEREIKQVRIFLFMENIAGFGNTLLLKRTEGVLKNMKFNISSNSKPNTHVSETLDSVVTTIGMEPSSEATPEIISQRHPEWKVPSGNWSQQFLALVTEAYDFQPDVVISAPATSYDYNLRPLLATALGKWEANGRDSVKVALLTYLRPKMKRGANEHNQAMFQDHHSWVEPLLAKKARLPDWPTIWLGEYDSGSSAEESELQAPIEPMGVGKNSIGVLIPELDNQLQQPFSTDVAKVLAEKAESDLVLFAYLHAEEPVRDYLLLARELSRQRGSRAIVVMTRMKCVPRHDHKEHEFRNMQAMLQNLTKRDGAFRGTLKVIRAESGGSIWWNPDKMTCDEVPKKDLELPHIGVEGGEELRAALA
mmetsp:Transcript_50381/g.97297  ORF Transcript_50381/g.97297 Transcript_50381/m.97297 type:complete len:578 (-) Transcript_50381:65-1798(-)